MATSKYVKILIDDSELDITEIEALPIAITYKLENREDFSKKQSSEAFDIDVPATPNNDKIFNTFHNPGQIDLSPGAAYKNIRRFYLEQNGAELLIGKAFLKKASKARGLPESYQINAYGKNADWLIDLRETTLYDILSTCVAGGPFSFTYSKAYIESTWAFDGTDEAMPFVFAPVKYNGYMDPVNLTDTNYAVETMRPSISVYWLLYWAFKSIGYKIESVFFSQFYGQRLVLPWTWGSFLNTDKTKFDIHRFTASSASLFGYTNSVSRGSSRSSYVDLKVTNIVNNNGSGDYTYNTAAKRMRWTYNAPNYGSLLITFSVNIQHTSELKGLNASYGIVIEWYVNGVLTASDLAFSAKGKATATAQSGNSVFVRDFTVSAADTVDVFIRLDQQAGVFPGAFVLSTISILNFTIDAITIPPGGTISMDTYLQFKNYKFLDLLGGLVDLFNFEIDTDSINKTVLIESMHSYCLFDSGVGGIQGFFKNRLDWTSKQDIEKPDIMELFSEHEREFYFKFKDDSSDGGLKQIQDRAQTPVGQGKYVFSERFKAGKRTQENRFFAATCHYDVLDFKAINGTAPQFICILAENISNRSSNEAENTFLPKIAFYHGNEDDPDVTGLWKWDGVNQSSLPYMYAVNYKAGGEDNPILSYCDENINGVIGRGLMRRAFLKRLATMENGQYLTKWFRLNNNDVTRKYHRELISIGGLKWECREINGYLPLKSESTQCLLVMDTGYSQENALSCYPSFSPGKSILADVMIDEFDVKYARLLRLPTDK